MRTAPTCLLVIAAMVPVLPAPAFALEGSPQIPVADAGPSRYAGRDPIRLDGTASFSPGGGPIVSYEWFQLSGPAIDISGADTATPEISGFAPTRVMQSIEIGLVVGDGERESDVDTVSVIVVPAMAQQTMSLVNPPFRPGRPTLITFGGGDCVDGVHMPLDETWQAAFNIITGRYFHPYVDQAFQAVVLLSAFAPDYRQPIQTIGFSTGGNPAAVVANVINQYIRDPRYAVNRMTLLDAYCLEDFDERVAAFSRNPVAGEPAWADVYRSAPEPIPGALNVSFYPGGTHATPYDWYLASIDDASWPDGDMYNHGVTAGYFVSVGGPAGNLQIETDGLDYVFECPRLAVDCLRPSDGAGAPGRILEPVQLIGPPDGGRAGPAGAVLSCETSEHAMSYELLFGPDAEAMTVSVSETSSPPDALIEDLPYAPTVWTIRVRDAVGSTIFASPRAIMSYEPLPVRRAGRRVRPSP